MGHSVDPDKELAKLEKKISDMEGTLSELIVKAKKCKYVSSLDYVDGDKSKLRMVVEKLPEDDQLGKKDGDKFVYCSTTTDFDVPGTANGKSLTSITCSQEGSTFKLTQTYDNDETQTFEITVPDNKGPACTEEVKDGENKKYETESGDGKYVVYVADGYFVPISASTAGTSISHTGVSASATAANFGITGVSGSLVGSSASLDGVFVCDQVAGFSNALWESDVSGSAHAVLASFMSLGPVGIIVGMIAKACHCLKAKKKQLDMDNKLKVEN